MSETEELKAKAIRLYELALEAASTACVDRCGSEHYAECEERFAAIEKEKP